MNNVKNKLSAGICDHCEHCTISNLGGGTTEPDHFAGFCPEYKTIIEPVPEDMQLTECPKYKKRVVKHTILLTEEQLNKIVENMLCPGLYDLENQPCEIGNTEIKCFYCKKSALLTANKKEGE
jgi:hypothetical protein